MFHVHIFSDYRFLTVTISMGANWTDQEWQLLQELVTTNRSHITRYGY